MRGTLRRLWYLVRRSHREADLVEEMAFHRAMAAADAERAGHAPPDAMRMAQRAFGNTTLTMDRARDVWVPALLRDVWSDLRFAIRIAIRAPSVTVVAVATLALSLGFNTTLFTIVDGMGGQPAVVEPDRVVSLGSLDSAGRPIGVSYADFVDWSQGTKAFEMLVAFSTAAVTMNDRNIAADRVAAAYISPGTFALIGERPILGRDFRPEDDRPSADRIAIIAASLWKGRYGGDPFIIGRVIRVNGTLLTVVGVMREGFRFPLVHDLWQPLSVLPGLTGQPRNARGLRVVGRLRPGVCLEEARAELTSLSADLSTSYPATNASVRPRLQPFTSGFDLTNPWNAMFIAVVIVLLIACANVANLLIARATHRSNEIAVRTALGATRWRIVRQLLIESVLLAALAGIAAIGVAWGGVRLWLASMPAANWPYWYHFAINARVLAYLAFVSLGSVLLFGVGPAVYVSGCYPADRLKDMARATARRPARWSHILLIAQLALTLSLLAGAGLLERTLIAVYRADSIVNTSRVLMAGIGLPPQKYRTPAQRLTLYSDLEQHVGGLPSVDATTVASGAPFYDAPVWSIAIEGHRDGNTETPTASYVLIGSQYFETLGLQLVRGRAFTDVDGTRGHEAVIVNRLFASKYLSGHDPIGQRLRLVDPNQPEPTPPWLTVVGISPTVREHYAQAFDPVVYVPYRLNPRPNMVLLTRARQSAADLGQLLREQLRQLDPDLPLADIRPLDWLLSGTQFANRVFASLFGISAALGLLLAALGLHALIAHDIGQRTQEIGVRMALGAQARQVTWLFVGKLLTPLVCGIGLGFGGAIAVGRLVKGMLIETSPTDPLTLVMISVTLIAVALVAAFRPARHAAQLDPVNALRYE
jgi:predicted permease